MTMNNKKLIEVALPLDAINAASSYEKMPGIGPHPRGIHHWWARRPLTTARAVIFAQMVDDPSVYIADEAEQEKERERLFSIIEEMVKWENTNNEDVMEAARAEIRKSWQRTCKTTGDDPNKLPAFHDPFAGGGSIPLEAQRLGLEAYASDLNPVAVMINKAMIEIPPRFAGREPVNPQWLNRTDFDKAGTQWQGAQGLAADVAYYGKWMRDEAEKRIGHLYPKVKIIAEMIKKRPDLKPYKDQELTVIAWIWARTVKSPNPAFKDVDVPLISTYILSSKSGKETWLEPVIKGSEYSFRVKHGKPPAKAKTGTKLARGANFACILSGTPMDDPYIKNEAMNGRLGNKLLSIVCEGKGGRIYVEPLPAQEAMAQNAKPNWKPEQEMPANPRWFSPPLYGMKTYGSIFTNRQLVALTTFSDLVQEAHAKIMQDAQQSGSMDDEEMQARSMDEEKMQAGRLRPQVDHPLGPRPSWPHSNDSHPSWHSRGYLPHFEGGQIPQSVTFRLHDTLPQSVLDEWEIELKQIDDDQIDAKRRKKIEKALDNGYGQCYLKNKSVAEIVQKALLFFDKDRYQIHAWVIMPNHVHVLFTPLKGHTLSSILHSWKSFSAKEANKLLNRTGSFWQEEYFDRAIRDEEHFWTVVRYIHNNPVKAGLVAAPEDYAFSSAALYAGHNGEERMQAGSMDDEEMQAGRMIDEEVQAGSMDDEEMQAGRLRPQVDHPLGPRPSWPHSNDPHPSWPHLSNDPHASWPHINDQKSFEDGGQGANAYADAVAVYLAFAVDKMADLGNSLCRWESAAQCPRQLFGRQAIPMVWDFGEANPLSNSSGSMDIFIRGIIGGFEKLSSQALPIVEGHPYQSNAKDITNQDIIISTDPPYYDNIGYADLSDFFYVWMRASIKHLYPDIFATMSVPKTEELIASPYRHQNKTAAEEFFLNGLSDVISGLLLNTNKSFPITIYYAFKQIESNNGEIVSTGWETFIEAIISSQAQIQGTWPLRTENASRMVGQGTNALASSIVLVCRKRPLDAGITSRRDFQNRLRTELPRAIRILQKSHIAPVDMAQSAIGPGMAIFSQYNKVIEADGSAMKVRTALAMINEVLDEILSEQEGEMDADTRWAVSWYEQFGFQESAYGTAETLCTAKGTSMSGIVEAGIAASKGGKVKLLKRDDLPDDWSPETDKRLTVWEATQYLIRYLEHDGEQAAADILHRLGGVADQARDLAYRLYQSCERKGWAEEARSYNGLIITWPELLKQSQAKPAQTQGGLF